MSEAKVGFSDDDESELSRVFSSVDAAQLYEISRKWPPDRKAAMLAWLKAAHTRATIKRKYANAAELASSIDPQFRVTPAIQMIAESIEQVITEPSRNLLVTMAPQEGKSTMCAVWAPIRALQLDPNRRIILTTYADALAEEHSSACRDLISRFGSNVIDPLTNSEVEDKIGLSLSTNRISSWRVNGGRGGMVAVGLGSSITGRPADLLIIDDPYKNMMEADSVTHRRKVSEWMKSVALTRLAPDASVILIQTRWHPNDLAGEILKTEAELPMEERTWRHLNIPAVSEVGIADSLNREPGVAMISARGPLRDLKAFNRTKKRLGDRVWYALYQGSPVIPSGGLFSRDWFDAGRLPEIPAHTIARVVAIDPADSGEGDETGIVAAALTPTSDVVFTHDRSDSFTADKWAREAVMLAVEVGAREIALEAYAAATTYVSMLKQAWKDLRVEAKAALIVARAEGGTIDPVLERIALATDVPFTIYKWRGKSDSVGRSGAIRQAFETRRAHVVAGRMATFEEQACAWQAGQHQPDRIAAGLIAYDRLAELVSGEMTLPGARMDENQARAAAPSWLTRKI